MIAKKYLIENYDCSEYLGHYENDYLLNNSLLSILPYKDVCIHPICQHLIIGYMGEDKLELCYQFQTQGLWIFYPDKKHYKQIDSSLREFIDNCKDEITFDPDQ